MKNNSGDHVTVIKRDYHGEETLRYHGRLIFVSGELWIIKAFFKGNSVNIVKDIRINPGDKFIEAYYKNRNYNIFVIYEQDSMDLKCLYCNLGSRARYCDGFVIYKDYALDLLVLPDGNQMILDVDEFDRLPMPISRKKILRGNFYELQNKITLEAINLLKRNKELVKFFNNLL